MQLQINLASRAYVNRRGLYGFYALIGGGLVVLLAFNTAYLFRLRAHAAMLTTQLTELTRKVDSIGAIAEAQVSSAELEKRRRDVALANEILERDGFRWTEMLDRLEDVAVDGVSLRSIQPQFKEGSLSVTGVARSVHEMQEYLDSLLASPHFSAVYLLSQSALGEKEDAGGELRGVAFSIELKGVF